jgi:tetratricopeptide (TPR) repeat protein
VLRLVQAGATGYMLKTVTSEELVEAIRSVVAGVRVLQPKALEAVLDDYLQRVHDHPVHQPADDLTAREQLVLSLYEERWGRRDMKRIEELIDEYVRRFPKDPEGYRMRADLLASTGRQAEALKEYERLIAVNPNYAIAYNTLGYYWASKDDAAKAEDYLKRYRFLAPNDANPYDSLGELWAHTGRYDEAEEVLKKALAIKSDFFASYGHLGTVEAGRGNYEKAAEWFRKAADATDHAETRYNFRFFAAVMLADAGRLDEAIREMDAQAAEAALLPDTPDTRLLKGWVDFRRAAFLDRDFGNPIGDRPVDRGGR